MLSNLLKIWTTTMMRSDALVLEDWWWFFPIWSGSASRYSRSFFITKDIEYNLKFIFQSSRTMVQYAQTCLGQEIFHLPIISQNRTYGWKCTILTPRRFGFSLRTHLLASSFQIAIIHWLDLNNFDTEGHTFACCQPTTRGKECSNTWQSEKITFNPFTPPIEYFAV